jgi:HD-GYP domain-containing protein (c-di-GMP phosphodiesterase class II)/anti-anti-sigma regulatory factor
MLRTKFERVDVGSAGIAAFRIEGKLGFHENAKMQRLVEECVKRNLHTVLFDFSELSSLGGGVARILRDFAKALAARGGSLHFVITNDVIIQFLDDGENSFTIHRTFTEALSSVGTEAGVAVGAMADASVDRAEKAMADASDGRAEKGRTDAAAGAHDAGVIFMPYDSAGTAEEGAPERGDAGREQAASKETARPGSGASAKSPDAAPATEEAEAREGEPGEEAVDGDTEEIIAEIFGAGASASPPEWMEKPTSPFNEASPRKKTDSVTVSKLNRQLKRRILELKTLFSISADFNSIWDRRKLLDIFLLTSIAQGGVESAVFLENFGTSFKPIMSKGLDPEALMKLEIESGSIAGAAGESGLMPIETFAMDQGKKDVIAREGIEYVCPFRTKDGLSGLVLLGKRIAGRSMKEEDFEFLRILVNIAQGAYDNALLFEHEHERTLGIVKTLISIIEENTLLKGTSELVSRYVGMVAKSMDYPEERFKDLIYGTVLRDMGMVKVSDLILRSPRDLTKEEWETIKKHPEDGAEMLERMKFGGHVVDIVKTHHERFNGEGYPFGLRAKEIPLGSRIISVVESYAAMIHERPTRPALSEREALDTLKENYGLRYDREVVGHFVRIMEKEIAQSVGQQTASR